MHTEYPIKTQHGVTNLYIIGEIKRMLCAVTKVILSYYDMPYRK